MFKSLLRDPLLISVFVIALLIKLFSLNAEWVEQYYTTGVYPWISQSLRALFGWILFSLGDLVYAGAFIFFVAKAWKLIRLLAKRQVKEYLSWILFRKYLKLVLWIYIIFNLFWGLNYDRQGIAAQLKLEVKPYNKQDIISLAELLQERLCEYGDKVDSLHRLQLNRGQNMYNTGVRAYESAEKDFPFLRYRQKSVKGSLFSAFGHYFGFMGYYNPFTAEAQLKTTLPLFIKPFVVCHEMAHQLGYAKENEANFAGFLAARCSDDPEFVYSAYYDMYKYALGQLFPYSPRTYILLRMTAHPQVKADRRSQMRYFLKTANPVEPYITGIYSNYLKLNNQPHGLSTYHEVVAWLIAYMKKYGREAI